MSIFSTSEEDLRTAELAAETDTNPITITMNRSPRAARWPTRLFKKIVLGKLSSIQEGELCLVDDPDIAIFGKRVADCADGEIVVQDDRFYRMVVLGGANGAAEAYLRGYWETACLTQALRVLARNLHTASRIDTLPRWLSQPLVVASQWSRRNSLSGSRRNIAAHYDLGNDFFSLMLDPTMAYSCGVFEYESTNLAEASIEKFDRICRNLQLGPAHHVLEIGTGWGGFALHAAERYGCYVTTTTISREQHDFAARRFQASPAAQRIHLLNQDYRDLDGQYDKLVSIEMIEAVGEKYLPGYFQKCSQLLKPTGAFALQAITIPDQRYESYRTGEDFIQRYIFPGGFLPSHGKILECIGTRTDLRLTHREDFSSDYARTLLAWSENLKKNSTQLSNLCFDERFLRTWQYYLSYCQAGFAERKVGVAQYLFQKPYSD